MTALRLLSFIAFAGFLPAHAQEKPPPVKVRAVLHDPVHPVADLFYIDAEGKVFPVVFKPQDFSDAMLIQPVNGSLALYDKAAIDPEKPNESLAASVAVPVGMKQAICVVLPAPADTKPAYRMVLIDDSVKGFPDGESRVLSLIAADAAIHAGEHRIVIHPGKITSVPPVTKVDDFHMAQTNFYYRQNGASAAFAERQLQFHDATRRLFIIHATPGALQPTVTTIVDTRTTPR